MPVIKKQIRPASFVIQSGININFQPDEPYSEV